MLHLSRLELEPFVRGRHPFLDLPRDGETLIIPTDAPPEALRIRRVSATVYSVETLDSFPLPHGAVLLPPSYAEQHHVERYV